MFRDYLMYLCAKYNIKKIIIMKRFYSYLFIATVGLLGLVSCSSDDNSTPEKKEVDPIVGKWELKTMDLTLYEDGEVYFEYEDIAVEDLMLLEFDFKEDNTVDFTSGNLNQSGEMETNSETVTYVKNEDSVTITIEGEPETFSILKLNSSELHLFVTDEYSSGEMEYIDEITFKMVKM